MLTDDEHVEGHRFDRLRRYLALVEARVPRGGVFQTQRVEQLRLVEAHLEPPVGRVRVVPAAQDANVTVPHPRQLE